MAQSWELASTSVIEDRVTRSKLNIINDEAMMKKNILVALGSTATIALLSTPAMAQEEDRYFNGVYISGAFSGDTAQTNRDDRILFDIDGDGAFDDNVLTTTGANAFSPGFCSGNAVSARQETGCADNDLDEGYALRIGFDQHLGNGPVVAGLLIEGSKPGVEEFTSGFSTTPASYSFAREIDYTVAARARVGIAPGDGRGLFYATGGVGYARIDRDFATTNGANTFTPSDDRSWEFGWQAGGGAELMLTRNIGLGLEYLYSRYDDEDYTVAVGRGTAPATNPFILASDGTDMRLSNDDFDYHSFRATLNFRF